MRLALIGFGNVGQALAEILARDRSLFPGLAALEERIVAVVTKSRGALSNPSGTDLQRALREIRGEGRFSSKNPEFWGFDGLHAARFVDYDVLIELSPLSIDKRGEPAISHVRAALHRGRHVVTANKGPVAFAYRQLSALARENSCAFLFESTVMDGAPIFNMARCSLTGCRIRGLRGILNSTTNYVLSRMELGDSLEAAVAQAQKGGFAESDPRLDLVGWDGAVKISTLVNVLMGGELSPFAVEREDFSSVDPRRPAEVKKAGKRLKYLCSAERRRGQVKASVRLEELAPDHPFATVSGAGAMLEISTDLMAPILVAQQNPTPADTAYGILADLLEILSRKY